MALRVIWYGDIIRDVLDGQVNLLSETLTATLHGPDYDPAPVQQSNGSWSSPHTTTDELDDEIVDVDYDPIVLSGKTYERIDNSRFRFTHEDLVWDDLDVEVRYQVVSAGTRLLYAIDPGEIVSTDEVRVDTTVDVSAGTADPNADSRTRQTLLFLTNRTFAGSVERVALGQYLGTSSGSSISVGQGEWNQIASITGKRPLVMEADVDGGATTNYGQLISLLADHQDAGGLVAVSMRARIPAISVNHELYASSTVVPSMASLTTPAHATYVAWHDRLDTYANFLEGLAQRGVTAILTPFPDCTATTGYWWTRANPTTTSANYQLAYQQLFDHLVVDRGLHNLLFVWQPHDSNTADGGGLSRARMYPGDSYVDLVGPKIVDPDPVANGKAEVLTDLLTNVPQKPLILGEFGWTSPIDFQKWLVFLKAHIEIVYAKSGGGTMSMHRHTNLSNAINDPWLIKLGDVAPFDPDPVTPNAAPVAVVSPNFVLPHYTTFTVRGDESYDPNDDAITYLWEQVSGDPLTITPGLTGSTITIEGDPGASSSPPAPVLQAVGPATSGTAAVTPIWPTHQADDVALLVVEAAGGEAVTLSTASGFVEVANSPQATGSGTAGTRVHVFWCRATTAAMASPVVADPGDHVYAQIFTVRGCIASGNPWDATAGSVKGTASTSATLTGLTTTIDNDLVFSVATRPTSSTVPAFNTYVNAGLVMADGVTAGLDEHSDAGTTSGNGGGFAVVSGTKVTAGVVAATTATCSNTANAYLTIALKPPAGSVSPPSGAEVGDYEFGLTVTDSEGAVSDQAICMVEVTTSDSSGHNDPTAIISPALTVEQGSPATFFAGTSNNLPDGGPVYYLWTVLDHNGDPVDVDLPTLEEITLAGPQTSIPAELSPVVWTVSVTVTNAYGLADVAATTLTINPGGGGGGGAVGDVNQSDVEARLLVDPNVLWVLTYNGANYLNTIGSTTGTDYPARLTTGVFPGISRYGKCARVEVFPSGAATGENWKKGVDLRGDFAQMGIAPQEECYIRWYVYVPVNWDAADGGKMGFGIAGGANPLMGGGNYNDHSWNFRLNWNPNSAGVPRPRTYLYVQTFYGQRMQDHTNAQNGRVFGFGAEWTKIDTDNSYHLLTKGTWHCVEVRVRMNTPGVENGILEGWFDGIKGLSLNKIQYRDTAHPTLKINRFMHVHYYGGALGPTTGPQYAYFDDVVISTAYIGPRV